MKEELETLRGEGVSPKLHAKLLIRYLEWHRQAKKERAPWKRLEQVMEGKGAPMPTKYVVSGTKLLRKYRGEVYEVIVEGKGYRYGGREYRSLSAIAKEITGTNWNGNLFFKCRRHG